MKTIQKREISLRRFVSPYDYPGVMDWDDVFQRRAPMEVEIGFGTGEFLTREASARPDVNFVGLELNAKRVFKTLRKLEELQLTNVRLLFMDARNAFEHVFQESTIEHAHCLFPCPWPKKGDVRNRLLSRSFLRLVNNRLRDKGTLTLVTDHHPYTDWVKGEVDDTGFSVQYNSVGAELDTKFERKWAAGGQDRFDKVTFEKYRHQARPDKARYEVKAYFLEDFRPDELRLDDVTGDVSLTFKDYVADPKRKKCMVHVIVTEPDITQQLWIAIAHTQKGWCVTAARGWALLPTYGVSIAIEAVYEAARRTS